jgi:hypothetical protein
MTGEAVQAGVLFAATQHNSSYLSRYDHRHFANGTRNRWSAACQPACEYEVFCDAETNNWRDTRPHLWGIRANLSELGCDGERVAKFPAVQNAHDPWHGYPVSALDERREFEHRPEPVLVNRWRHAGLISDSQASRIKRGKV